MPLDLVLPTLALALADSFATTSQILIFLLFLASARPLRDALVFLGTLTATYFACGFGGYLVLDGLQEALARWVPNTSRLSDADYYLTEALGGGLLVALGLAYAWARRRTGRRSVEGVLVERLRHLGVWAPALLGALISLTTFPVALPYLVALQRFAAVGLGPGEAAVGVGVYNLGYALPMLVTLGLWALARYRGSRPTAANEARTEALAVVLTVAAFVGFGLFALVDAGLGALTGSPLVAGRYF